MTSDTIWNKILRTFKKKEPVTSFPGKAHTEAKRERGISQKQNDKSRRALSFLGEITNISRKITN